MLDKTFWFSSPAKINLFLHVCGRRLDGYHNLQTLFQLLDYGDKIGLTLNKSSKITLKHNLDDVNFDDNLVVKAAKLLLPFKAQEKFGIEIDIQKSIPMGGGLGGGSSNAATVLKALNILWGCNLREQQLAELGLGLGADVPVFINGRTAFAEGVGDKLYNTEQPEKYFLVATPNVHISTQQIFTHEALPRNTEKLDFNLYNFANTKNDCEKLVCKLKPEVAYLVDRLLNYAPSRMTGTGSSVFAMFETHEQASNVIKHLPENASAFVAKGMNVSPLQSELDRIVQ